MANDIKGDKVENYKISDQMKGWIKSANQLNKIAQVLQMQKIKLHQDSMMLAQAAQGLQQAMPRTHTKDIQGMEF